MKKNFGILGTSRPLIGKGSTIMATHVCYDWGREGEGSRPCVDIVCLYWVTLTN